MPFCTKCGTKLDGVQKFCHTCGTPVPKSDAASTPATEKKSLSALLSDAGTKKVATSPMSIEKGNCKACGKPITGAVFVTLLLPFNHFRIGHLCSRIALAQGVFCLQDLPYEYLSICLVHPLTKCYS